MVSHDSCTSSLDSRPTILQCNTQSAVLQALLSPHITGPILFSRTKPFPVFQYQQLYSGRYLCPTAWLDTQSPLEEESRLESRPVADPRNLQLNVPYVSCLSFQSPALCSAPRDTQCLPGGDSTWAFPATDGILVLVVPVPRS
ncbi:hypothetical protein mRhiFer1_009227 [Rhinolophus ferrumequinum]|uniref:Uncharacterized protein n=1 Tax=Rhinolophus ferrumequinum TaxID=59479 RepID=A0A7J7S841_RHIFE|nr:hypothetical protein mRhiFer1_009227 [Rhinolophus ferrumequinum]